ncbi:hypothetical protein [Pedobacter sp. SL55]|uniref:hypothetical protein n=1 Tax=Pedobacter sp. SL55 TaxID=2995161 RepID=UPI00226FB88F|nr:hypothetical protein [Pedobacter sp. SL55]WAC40908.1 hypothetical protein OVA16_00525 [Pedobacter sp. SL55]
METILTIAFFKPIIVHTLLFIMFLLFGFQLGMNFWYWVKNTAKDKDTDLPPKLLMIWRWLCKR